MQLGLLLEKYQTKTESNIVNKRQWLIKEFVDELNKERKGTKLKNVTGKMIAIKLSHLNEFDLSYFLSECRDYKHRKGSFGKMFFGALKNRLA